MPVRNNITGLWRHYKLANMGASILTGADATGSLIGTTGGALKDKYLIVTSANTATQQDVEPLKLMVGTPKTKAVNIGKAQDTLSINGPMFFCEETTASTSCVPKLLVNTTNVYGDASSVAAAMITSATNFTVDSNQTSYADSIGITIDESGAQFDISMIGDPTTLFANFADLNNSVAPFGYGGGTGSPTEPLSVALRAATFYDFYVNAQVTIINSSGDYETNYQVGGAIRSMNINIGIEADPIVLLGMGQAPYFAISQVGISGSMKVVFPLLSAPGSVTFPTVVPTWQSVPNAFNPTLNKPGQRTVESGSPSPLATCSFPDAPDKFILDTVSVIPKYVSNQAPLFASGAFGNDINLDTGMKVVMKNAKVNISAGVLEADMDYIGIFTSAV